MDVVSRGYNVIFLLLITVINQSSIFAQKENPYKNWNILNYGSIDISEISNFYDLENRFIEKFNFSSFCNKRTLVKLKIAEDSIFNVIFYKACSNESDMIKLPSKSIELCGSLLNSSNKLRFEKSILDVLDSISNRSELDSSICDFGLRLSDYINKQELEVMFSCIYGAYKKTFKNYSADNNYFAFPIVFIDLNSKVSKAPTDIPVLDKFENDSIIIVK